VPSLDSLIEDLSRAEDRDLERTVLGSDVATEIAAIICEFVARQLAPVETAIFYHTSVGIVAGLRIVDGRDVVVKVHRWQVSIARLTAVQRVQAHLAASGLPVPRPLCEPEPLGSGIAVIEELRSGDAADGHDPLIRRCLAAGLHRFVSAAQPLGSIDGLGSPVLLRPPGSPLWPEPHDLRFDFQATRDGAEWIDDLGRLARRRLQSAADSAPVIGHVDWRVGNLGFEEDRITAIYDWDSVAIAPEAFVVGAAAAQFCADWTRGATLPSVDEMGAFVAEYEQTRGTRFDVSERDMIDAANLVYCAYLARCEHSDMRLGVTRGRSSSNGWTELLRQREVGSPIA
jgi:aminoglycoside phosphotransferase (APT) family kinase protein